jgi:hypothetical protein
MSRFIASRTPFSAAVNSFYCSSRGTGLSAARSFSSSHVRKLNPLIDGMLEEIQRDDEKRKEKRQKIIASRPKILIPRNEDSFLKAEHGDRQDLAKQKESKAQESNGGDSSRSNGGNGNGNNNNNNDSDGFYEHEYEEETRWSRFKDLLFKSFETSSITLASLLVLAGAGYSYHKFYGMHVISKMSGAFDKGDDAFEITMHKRTTAREGDWIERPQQELLDAIIRGDLIGRYFLVTGEKGCGKSSMILNSMKRVDSFNCSFIDAHSDPEIFRIRLGKALNFEYHEDYIGSLFSIRGPRDTTALLDIERAFNKLEEVAVQRVKKNGKPLVLIINNAQLIKDDEEGVKLVELLQQKAEALSGAGLVTMIFNSDDYWLYERLKKLGTRLEVVNVHDFNRKQAVHALKVSRRRYYHEEVDDHIANHAYDLIGGRPQHISEVAKHSDLLQACHRLIDREKTWFLNQCGLLGSGMDDDVNESGKFSTSAMLLMKEFADLYKEKYEYHAGINKNDHKLPELPLWRARQIMTRNDYIQQYDNLNIFTIDSANSFVRADSVPMMRGFLEICEQPGFNELLEETLQRVGDIESLGRTREIVAKDLVLGSSYRIKKDDDKYIVKLHEKNEGEEGDDDDDPIKMQPTTKSGEKSLWKTRLDGYKQGTVPKQDK